MGEVRLRQISLRGSRGFQNLLILRKVTSWTLWPNKPEAAGDLTGPTTSSSFTNLGWRCRAKEVDQNITCEKVCMQGWHRELYCCN
jgi:hypothetical protein